MNMRNAGPRRRDVLLAGAVAVMLPPRLGRAAGNSITVVLESEVTILDPHYTTANITRNFGYHVFDMLFAMDSKGDIQPQMVERHEVSTDGLRWHFILRDGLAFHDGAPVTATDCVASLRRWAPRDSLGRMLVTVLDDIRAEDERNFTITLKAPFPLMLQALGKPNAPVPFIMPTRIVAAAGDGRISEITGSGPFRFRKEAWRAGDTMLLSRFEQYQPRGGKPDFLAGGKTVHIDELVLKVVPDDATAANALMAGEIDYMQYLPFDLLATLEKSEGVQLMNFSGLDMFQGNFRVNHASGPFADPAVRAVLWKLVDQREILGAIGIPERFGMTVCDSFWLCGTPLATDAGAEVAKFDVAAAKAALAKTSYKGEPVVILQVSGSISTTASKVLTQHMREAGFTVDEQVMDWGTLLARRAKKDGWSLFGVYSNGVDMDSPLTHFYVSNNCADYPGWNCSEAMTGLLRDFAAAPDDAVRKRVAADIQVEAYRQTPSVMWGQFSRPAGYRSRLKNMIQSSFPMFWEVEIT
jgi:peptide/nickel transport system substrate-binding protein